MGIVTYGNKGILESNKIQTIIRVRCGEIQQEHKTDNTSGGQSYSFMKSKSRNTQEKRQLSGNAIKTTDSLGLLLRSVVHLAGRVLVRVQLVVRATAQHQLQTR